MLGGWPRGGIWLSSDPADMRRSFDALCALVCAFPGRTEQSGRYYLVWPEDSEPRAPLRHLIDWLKQLGPDDHL